MDWPARSPDLDPIENVWDFLGRRLAARTLPPVTIRELRLALQDEWAALPQQLIETLILSMGRRCEICLAVREIISPTKDRMFLAGHPSQGCFGLQSHCAPCYFFNQASFYPSDFSLRRSRKSSISAERRGRADRKANQEIKLGDVRKHRRRYAGRIIGKLEEGRRVTSVAAEFRIAHSIVSRLWRQFQTTGTAIRGFSSGRLRGTTPEDDRYIVLQARRNRWQTAGEIARHTTQATGRPISRFTVARRLHGGGLFPRRPVRCVPLTPAHRRRRSLWFREHRNWRDNEWGRVLFTDESRFSFSSDSHRILIWRERGSRNHPSNIIEGTVRLFRGAMGLQFLFMDDNAPCHHTVAAEQLLESEDIERMDWPARSPDLNPIEHVWEFLGRRLAARTLPPVTIREL
ncbi:transposable element Tc1 transposase [Trichonephila clavipes]|nr:transposable element Tc1 transposase [Trichonephila clavipes]